MSIECIPTDDPLVAFKDCDAAFLVGAMPRKAGMERKDLLAANVKIFKVQGQALDKVAKKSVKVRIKSKGVVLQCLPANMFLAHLSRRLIGELIV